MCAVYSELPGDSIRLLDFVDTTTLEYRLVQYSLQDAPEFMALSYTWGDSLYQRGNLPGQRYKITVDGVQISVQQNLYDALEHLSERVVDIGKYYLWVDYVCIDQTNQEERARQVRIMRDIYEHSVVVIGWLGIPKHESETKHAIEYMKLMEKSLLIGKEAQLIVRKSERGNLIQSTNRVTIPSMYDPKDGGRIIWEAWTGIIEILNRPYWTRTWIFQEFTTPKQVTFFCGDHDFDLRQLHAASIEWMRVAQTSSEFSHSFPISKDQHLRLGDMVKFRKIREADHELRLIDLLRLTRFAKCTDPRDKVFAVLGHASDREHFELSVGYEQPLHAVYSAVVKYALSDPNIALGILGDVHTNVGSMSQRSEIRSGRAVHLPSWIPDWRYTEKMTSLLVYDKLARPVYNPFPGSNSMATSDSDVLQVLGFTLKGTTLTYLTGVGEPELSLEVLREWFTKLKLAGDGNVSNEQICRSILADAINGPTDYDTVHKKLHRNCYHRRMIFDVRLINNTNYKLDDQPRRIVKPHSLGDLRSCERRRYSADSVNPNIMTDAASRAPIALDVERLMIERAHEVCGGRRMGLTDQGHIGVFPAAAEEGDIVALFNAGHVLYLLRPVVGFRREFIFVGECYVDGLMDGQALPLCEMSHPSGPVLRLI